MAAAKLLSCLAPQSFDRIVCALLIFYFASTVVVTGEPSPKRIDNAVDNQNVHSDNIARPVHDDLARDKQNGLERDVNTVKLAETKECASDLRALCGPSTLANNYDVLECVQDDKRVEDGSLSPECHHLLWMFKRNLTQDSRFNSAASKLCPNLLAMHPECQPGGRGQMLACLMDHADNASDTACRTFLNHMEVLVFSDYRLIYKFTEECDADIQKFHCGRLAKTSSEPHSQGQTIECLESVSNHLSEGCRAEILRVARLQGEDFHLDRPLFFACRDDRDRFCADVPSGEGRVYKCLFRHRTHRDMSAACQEKLLQREKLTMQDYRVNRGLSRACRDDIRMYHCRDDTSQRREFRLAQILLCLENALHKDYPVAAECHAEMLEHRRYLMEQYQLTPDLATACEADIATFCQRRLEQGGKTLHCLMRHVRPSPKNGMSHISDKCRREVELVLKEVGIGEDWRVDPVLQESCQRDVEYLCRGVKPGRGSVLSCLMDHIENFHMSEMCKESLLHIQYFVARDFKLDPMLYQQCHTEAVKYCKAKKEWHDNPSRMDPERGPIVLPCLYRYAYHPDQSVRLSKGCLYEVRRVMRQRAISIDLHPEIEEPCMTDLASLCSDKLGRGEEMQCLQQSLERLTQDCRSAVANYTEEEAEHLELNYPLYKACHSVLKDLCGDLLTKDVDQGDLLQCLISHKNEPRMKEEQTCRVTLEHFQLISLKDYRFSFNFKEACKKDVLTYCKHVKTKAEVVSCLSQLVLEDVTSDKEPSQSRVSENCRRQLRVELFQREENIRLDPDLDTACHKDQQNFCSNVSPGEGRVLECLKNHRGQLSRGCHVAIFRREKLEMQDNAMDYTLITACKSALHKFCADRPRSQALTCLAEYRLEPSLDDRCRSVVQRRLVEQNSDYRLNPRLQKSCRLDIAKFCSNIVLDKDSKDTELEGKVIQCLKVQFVRRQLTKSCEPVVMGIIREVARDYQLDPVLARACSSEIQNPCKDEHDMEECLKARFQNRDIKNPECKKEVARLIHEGKADVQADPILHKACLTDIKHYCHGLSAGHGNILSCLLTGLESDTVVLTDECRTLLSKRVEMFEYAAQVAPVESIRDVVQQIANSPSRNYFLVVAMGALGVIFLGGLFCGRVTKRVPISMKNR